MYDPTSAEVTIEPDLTRATTWAELRDWLESFPAPRLQIREGGVERREWVFRGVADSRYPLAPSIERRGGGGWAALEKRVVAEFKSRARLHLPLASVPDDELGWLALMQHYRIPSRLLDFTYSPFVALYFAVQEHEPREPEKRRQNQLRVWAVNAPAVRRRFDRVLDQAQKMAQGQGKKKEEGKKRAISFLDFYTDADIVHSDLSRQTRISEALTATGTSRTMLGASGAVAIAAPSHANPRLASQQGIFLVNCAESLALAHSLNKMMSAEASVWCRAIDISVDLCSKIEERLFQMNIHGQSLFPDLEGLARLIEEKIRFQWPAAEY